MNENEIINKCIQNDFRTEEMKTVLNSRISLNKRLLNSQFSSDEISKTETRIQTYKDCLEILNKEFFELNIPDEISIEEYIKKTRDKIVNNIVGDYNRGSNDYIRNLRRAGKVAEIIESLCYQMFSYGYNLKPESPRNSDSQIRSDIKSFI